MAQKNFFALVTLIACALIFAPAELVLFLFLSGKTNSAMTLAISNIFGIVAGIVMIIGVYKNVKAPTFAWAGFSCIAAAWFGFAAFAALIGGGIFTVVVFILFVLAIIRYEDLGAPRV